MAVEYDGGVVIGADSRTTTGYLRFLDFFHYCLELLRKIRISKIVGYRPYTLACVRILGQRTRRRFVRNCLTDWNYCRHLTVDFYLLWFLIHRNTSLSATFTPARIHPLHYLPFSDLRAGLHFNFLGFSPWFSSYMNFTCMHA